MNSPVALHPHRAVRLSRVTQALVAASLAAFSLGVSAQGAADIEQVRQTTLRLINLLVEQGILTRARADALLREAEAATAAPATRPDPAPAAAGSGTAAASAGAAAAGSAAAPGVVRVPFVPEIVRKELKDELRAEVAAQALREGWAGPNALPSWTRNLRLEGDLRVRYQFDNFDDANAPAVSVLDTNRNRAITLANNTEDRHRLRVRGRLGATASVDGNWSAGVRLSTGSLTDPLSSNQTLGTYGNRFTVVLDRAFIRYREGDFNVAAGRFGSPWFGTDLVWANDLSYDGVAVQWNPAVGSQGWKLFATGAVMPIQEVELSSSDKWLLGVQVGVDSPANRVVRGKLGVALYDYRNITGAANAPNSSLNDFTAPAFAQKGNTYYNISSDPTRPLLALASRYRLFNVTGTLDMELVGGKHLLLTGDVVKNMQFDRAAVSGLLGQDVEPRTRGLLARAAFGDLEVNRLGAWQVSLGYKYLERDAVLDAFTDSDLRLGGTDTRGYVLGVNYGIGRNTVAAVRWYSADTISGVPYAVDGLHLEISTRF